MVEKRSQLVLMMLVALFMIHVLMALLQQGFNLVFLPGALISILDEKTHTMHPLMIGSLPIHVFFLIFALILLNITHELFGKHVALRLCFVSSLALMIFWLMVFFEPVFQLLKDQSSNAPLLQVGGRHVLEVVGTLMSGFGTIVVLVDWLRHWTGGRFSPVRLFLGHFMGFAVLAAATTVLSVFPKQLGLSELALFLTRYLQWLLFFVFLFPVYYGVKGFFVLLVGGPFYEQTKAGYLKKSFFKLDEEKSFFGARRDLQEKRFEPQKSE